MQPAKQINERKRAQQVNHIRALLSFIEQGEPCEMRFEPTLHVITDKAVLTVELDREAFLRFLPLDF